MAEETEITQPDAKAGGDDAAMLDLIRNEVDIDLGDKTDDSATVDEPEDGDKQKAADKGNGKDKENSDTESDKRRKALDEDVKRLERAKKEAQRELHELRQEKKKAKGENKGEEEVTLSDQQILGILEEHKDDPKVLLNTMKYFAQQAARGAKKETLNETEVLSKKKGLDEELRKRYPDFDDDASEIRQGAEKIKSYLGISEHPYGDFFAVSAQVFNSLPAIVKHWYDEGKKAALSETADAARKKDISDGKLTPGGSKKTDDTKGGTGLTPQQLDTAKRLGFTSKAQLKLYADQILKAKPRKED